jgi:hypothetical protein
MRHAPFSGYLSCRVCIRALRGDVKCMLSTAGHSSVCDNYCAASPKKSRDSCQLDRENQKYGQLYRKISRLFLLHVLSSNKTCLEYAMVDVPSAFGLAPISSEMATEGHKDHMSKRISLFTFNFSHRSPTRPHTPLIFFSD